MERWLANIHLCGTVQFREFPLIALGPGRCPAPGRRPAAGGRRSSCRGSWPGGDAGEGPGDRDKLAAAGAGQDPGRRRGSYAGHGHRGPAAGGQGTGAGAASHCRPAADVVSAVAVAAVPAGCCCCSGHLRPQTAGGQAPEAQCSSGWEGSLHFLAPCCRYRDY